MKMDDVLEKQVRGFLRVGKKVQAITAVQNHLKIGLKNSKDLVDSIEKLEKTDVKRPS